MFAALEAIEFDASADLWDAVPAAVRAAHAVDQKSVAGVACFLSRGLEPAAIFRRAAGLGVARPASPADLDAVCAQMDRLGLRYAVPLAGEAQPSTLAANLEQRGFTRGYAWMKFSRPCDAQANASTDLQLRVVGKEEGAAFGKVVAAGFGLPPAVGEWVGVLAGRDRWVCVMAFAGAVPVAAGAAYVKGEYAWLGFGATLETHRRHGAQNAILARRIAEAAKLGARVAVTETGERQEGKPSNSYRNILRAGFEERYLRQNYLSPKA